MNLLFEGIDAARCVDADIAVVENSLYTQCRGVAGNIHKIPGDAACSGKSLSEEGRPTNLS